MFVGGTGGVLRFSYDDSSWEQLDPSSYCSALSFSSVYEGRIYAGLKDSFAVSNDMGENWSYHESPGEFLCMSSVQLSGGENLFAGHVNRGVYRCSGESLEWAQTNRGLRADMIFSVDSVLSGTGPVVAAGTFSGVYLKDGPGAWKNINNVCAESVLIQPGDMNTIFAGGDWGVYRTVDRGNTWQFIQLFDSDDVYAVSSLASSEKSPETVFAGTYFYSGDRGSVFKSSDKGMSFKEVVQMDVPVNCIAVDPFNSDIIYAGTGNFNVPVRPGALYVSVDNGRTWEKSGLQDVVVNSIYVSSGRKGLMYAGCGAYDYSYSGIYRSDDGGKNWDEISAGFPHNKRQNGLVEDGFSVTDVTGDCYDSSIVYAASYDQGIYLSTDKGSYWTNIGLCKDYTYCMDTNSTRVLNSHNDAGLLRDTVWKSVLAGTGRGLLRMQTEGLGVISGRVISGLTGEMIDNADVSSDSSECLSVDGYYMLLVPAGVHTITASCSGYRHESLSSVSVDAGEQVAKDIFLQPIEDSDGSCIVTMLEGLDINNRVVKRFREFRRGVLGRSVAGRMVIRLYYLASPFMCRLANRSEKIRSIFRWFVEDIMMPWVGRVFDEGCNGGHK